MKYISDGAREDDFCSIQQTATIINPVIFPFGKELRKFNMKPFLLKLAAYSFTKLINKGQKKNRNNNQGSEGKGLKKDKIR